MEGVAAVDPESGIARDASGKAVGVEVDGTVRAGFDTPSRRLEIFSPTMKEWGWEEQSFPGYIRSHVHWSNIDAQKGEYLLLPTFRLPTLIHTRSGNAKWLNEIAHTNPLWVHPVDAERIGVRGDGVVRVSTEIGHFVIRVWVTEGLRPGVVACSHHLGRWRLQSGPVAQSWSSSLVDLNRDGSKLHLRVRQGPAPFDSTDPDSRRVFWGDGGVHQNLTFPVHPDPISGMHCWHQRVRIERPQPGDKYGDLFVDTNKSFENYKEWLAMTRPAPGPGGLRRPLWFKRPLRPIEEMYYLNGTYSENGEAGTWKYEVGT